jgi:prephenate dehydratase/chorismate mutase/prephenate dehydratase
MMQNAGDLRRGKSSGGQMRFRNYILRKAAIAIAFITASLVFSGCGSNERALDLHQSAADSFKENATISYLGPEGTYTEEAARYFFDSTGSFLPKKTVEDAIEDAASGASDYAVIPQENTIGGAVTNYVDALLERDDVYVVGEVIIPISQTLMGIPGTTIEEIKTVYSHAQGIKQSEQWRKEHMPDAAAEEMESTAAAAAYVAGQQDKSIAAVAAPGAAKLYGLEVLAENVQITDANKTRFYVLSKQRMTGGTNAVFAATCEANRIDDIIARIHDSGLELVTIHDRPEGSRLGKYNYIIEVVSAKDITDDQINTVCSEDDIRFMGRFDAVLK